MTEDLSNVYEDAVQLLERGRVVEVKSDKEYNVYLKEYDESFTSTSLHGEIRQVHPRKKNDTPFAVRLYMVVDPDE